MGTLVVDAATTRHHLAEQLTRARTARATPETARAEIDTFLAASSRHLGAALHVLVPLAEERLPDGTLRARAYVAACRRHEEALACVAAKAHHSARTAHDPWSRVWHEAAESFRLVWELELELVRDLDPYLRPDDPDWARALHTAELSAPTRPHPHIPHRGLTGRAARLMARTLDQILDAAHRSQDPSARTSSARTPLPVQMPGESSLLSHHLQADPQTGQKPSVGRWAPEPRRVREVSSDTE